MILTAAIVLFIYVYLSSGGNIPRAVQSVPVVDPIIEGVNHMSLVPATMAEDTVHPYQAGHKGYLQPEWDCQKNVVTQHRYPNVSGGNISTVMHKGWNSLLQPAPNNPVWMDLPPAEMGGYSL